MEPLYTSNSGVQVDMGKLEAAWNRELRRLRRRQKWLTRIGVALTFIAYLLLFLFYVWVESG